VGKFVKDDVVAVFVVQRALFAVWPGQNHGAPMPAFAQPDLFTFRDDIAVVAFLQGFEGARIDQDGAQRIVPLVDIHDQQTGLCRDGNAHALGDNQTVAADELHLVEEAVDLAARRGSRGEARRDSRNCRQGRGSEEG